MLTGAALALEGHRLPTAVQGTVSPLEPTLSPWLPILTRTGAQSAPRILCSGLILVAEIKH